MAKTYYGYWLSIKCLISQYEIIFKMNVKARFLCVFRKCFLHFISFHSLQVVESLLGESGDLIQTGSPCILCTPLPNHWRSNKSLPSAFKVFTFQVSLTLCQNYKASLFTKVSLIIRRFLTGPWSASSAAMTTTGAARSGTAPPS